MHGRPPPQVDRPLRSLRIHVPVATVALGLLIGLFVWAGPASGGTRAAGGNPSAFRAIDFNQPATLAWSLQLVGPATEALRDVTCSTSGRPVFVCHGVSPDGTEATVQILVAPNGASWASQ